MKADHFEAGHLFDQLREEPAALFQEIGADLFDEVGSFRVLRQLLLGGGEHPLEAEQDHVVDDVSLRFLGAAAHVIFFELNDRVADLRLDLPLCFSSRRHGSL